MQQKLLKKSEKWKQPEESLLETWALTRGRSRAAATSKMESFVITVNGWKPLTIITKLFILDVIIIIIISLFNVDVS